MDSEYDIFEVEPDGGLFWKCSVAGRDAVLTRLESLAAGCENELRVVNLSSGTVVATTPPKPNGKSAA